MENEDNWRHSFECAIPNHPRSLCRFVSLSLCLFFMSRMTHNRREPSESRDAPSISLHSKRISPLDSVPVLDGIPPPEPQTVPHVKVATLSVHHHEERGSAVDPLIRILNIDLLLFLRGKDIGPMDPRSSQDQQGATRENGGRKRLFRRHTERSDHTMNQAEERGRHIGCTLSESFICP